MILEDVVIGRLAMQNCNEGVVVLMSLSSGQHTRTDAGQRLGGVHVVKPSLRLRSRWYGS